MSKVRVRELSKELGISNTDLIEKLNGMGIGVTTAASGIEDSDVARVRASFKKSEPIKEPVKAAENEQKQEIKGDGKQKQDIGKRDNHKGDNRGDKKKGNQPRLFRPDSANNNRGDRKAQGNNFRQGERRGFGEKNENKGDNRNNGERRSFGDNRNNGERRSSGDNHNGERRSFGDNRSNGERRSFNDNRNGEKRSFGEKKDFGDRRFQGERRNFDKDKDAAAVQRTFNKSFKNDKPHEKVGFETKPSREQRAKDDRKSRGDFDREGREGEFGRKHRNNNSNNNENYSARSNKSKKNAKKPQPQQPKPAPVQEIFEIAIPEMISVKDLAEKLKVAPSSLVMRLMKMGKMVNINQEIDFDTVEEMCLEMNVLVEHAKEIDIMEEAFKEEEDSEESLKERPPVVVVMGHVDHGKTSLLDAIRHSHVTAKEAGGITQHIGAYTVSINKKPITFLDTPGHEAFTAMRMRGAQVTDIAILVVAADDGVMPQTIEAINHAKAAGVEIIVAINKIDKPGANPDRVKQELVEYGLISEDWGGSTICVPVSAATKEGLDTLLEMIILTAEMKELKANPDKRARGNIIEAQLDKGRGAVATVLVQSGTLNVGDPIVAGSCYGKVRAMMNDKGMKVKKAGPSVPVEILGLNEVPMAGDMFYVAENERQARQVAESVVAKDRRDMLKNSTQKVSLDDLFNQIESGKLKELNIVIKADVQGSVEAVKQSLEKLSNEEVRIRTIHGGVGAITESDVMLASASNAIIIGFNVRPEASAKSVAEDQEVDIRLYRVIYNAIEDIEAAMKGLLDPVYEEKVIAHAEIRQLFKASGVGTIGGSYVLDGKIQRNCQVRIIRNGIVVYDGELENLRRGKDDVKEVATGFECGLLFKKFNDIKEGDIAEAYVMQEVAR